MGKGWASVLGAALDRITYFGTLLEHLRMRKVSSSPDCLFLLFSDSWIVIAPALIASILVFITLVCCIVLIVKRKKTPSRAMSTTTVLTSHTTQLGVIQHSPPHPVQQPAANPYPSLPAPPYTLPSEPPPPYPGEEPAPQYSPPRSNRINGHTEHQ